MIDKKIAISELAKIVKTVVTGYKFNDFDFVILEDQLKNARLKIRKDDIVALPKNSMGIEEIVKAPEGYFQ